MSDDKHKSVKREGEPEVIYANDLDEELGWAMTKARLTLRYFRESLQQPRPDQQSFSLKARIRDGEAVEHIWLSEPAFDDDGLFYGTVNNDPVDVGNVQLGARIGIGEEDVSDWLVIENGRLIGGYTIRVFRDRMEEEERRAFDLQTGMFIDEGVDHFAHDMTTPEGAVLCLEDAYTAGDLEAAIACKDFLADAKLMLDRIPEMQPNPALIEKTAETLELSFRNFMEDGGMPSFEGVERAFPERVHLDEDTVLLTEVCYHPGGNKTLDRLLVIRKGDEWRVGPPANVEVEDEA